jgi:hypothetical protein
VNCKSGELLHAFGIEHAAARADSYVTPDAARVVEGVRRRRRRLVRPLFFGKLSIKRWW